MVLVGPSGSGKSTALRMLAGLEEVSSGEVRIDGKDVSHKPPKDRDIAMVFQNYALYPHMSVAENMGFALKLKGVGKQERLAKVREAAALLDLEPYLERKPKALSGGQRQRVAMGRAIVREPAVFLMDEPLSNLDAKLRVETRANIAQLQSRLGTTTLYVTHDQVEAMTMGHRVAVLQRRQAAAGRHPAQPVRPSGQRLRRRLHRLAGDEPAAGRPRPRRRPARQHRPAAEPRGVAGGQRGWAEADQRGRASRVVLGLRGRRRDRARTGLKIEVKLVEELGADAYVYGELPGDNADSRPYVVRFDGRVPPRIGDVLSVDVRTGEEHAFHPETGERLG